MSKKITLSLALLSVALLAYDCSAEEEKGKQQGGKRSAAQGANRAQTGQGRGGPGAERDPAQLVARMMREFDKDGDQKLDSTELTALLKSMRQRRGGEGQGQPGQARQGKPRQGRQGAEVQRRRRGAEGAGNPGGERPKRPADE